LNPIFGESGVIRLARLLPKLITFDPPPCTWFIRKIQKPIRSRNGSSEISSDAMEKPPVPLESKSMLFFSSAAWRRSPASSLG
jgi:hypothetical protein